MAGSTQSARGGEFATSRRGAIDAYELSFIAEKVAAGVPVSAVANMLQRPVELVRAYSPPPPQRYSYGKPVVMALRVATSRPASPERRTLPAAARRIVADVLTGTGFTLDDLISRGRAYSLAHARQAVYAEMHRHGYSLSQIGRWLERDHTSVLHGVAAHANRQGASQ